MLQYIEHNIQKTAALTSGGENISHKSAKCIETLNDFH